MKYLIALLFPLLLVACKKESGYDHDEEIITTLTMTFTPAGGGTPLEYSFDDVDGPGGIAPVVDDIVLSANTTYLAAIKFLNKTISPVKDITSEISAESDAHRIYIQPSAGSNIMVSGLDADVNGVPLGLNSTWTTGAAANGTVKITLRHYGANPPGKASGDDVNSSKSSTDAEVVFNTTVQ